MTVSVMIHETCGLIHDAACVAPHAHDANGCPDDGLDCYPHSEDIPMEAQYEAALAYARTLGTEHGHAAATWYEVSDAKDAAAVLAGIEDCDPAILDTFPFADLSGEWADGLTGPQLVNDALVSTDDWTVDTATYVTQAEDWFSDICDAYEDAFRVAVELEIARYCQTQV